jgi:hypothetical protein
VGEQLWASLARALFALFFCQNTYRLVHGLADGSALYARHDLAVIVLWPVEVAAIAFIFRGEERRTGAPRGLRRRYCHTGSQAGPAGTRDPWPARGSAEGAVSEVDNLTARPQLNVAE